MTEASDAQLLREYVEHGHEAAFREIVVRHTDAVYSAALRQVRSPDVAQSVVTDLAHKAPSLDARASLPGCWMALPQHAFRCIQSVPGGVPAVDEAGGARLVLTEAGRAAWSHGPRGGAVVAAVH